MTQRVSSSAQRRETAAHRQKAWRAAFPAAAAAVAGVAAAVLLLASPAAIAVVAAAGCVLTWAVSQSFRRVGSETSFGLANTLTLARGALTALLAGAAVEVALSGALPWWWLVGLAAAALALDALDGPAARRTGRATAFGARFDMEVDAALLGVLAAVLAASGKVGLWVLLIGGMRYIYVAAAWLVPALRIPLPSSNRRRAVCAVQGLTLVVCLAPPIDAPAATALAALACALLVLSFAIDVVWQCRAPRQGLAEPAKATGCSSGSFFRSPEPARVLARQDARENESAGTGCGWHSDCKASGGRWPWTSQQQSHPDPRPARRSRRYP